MAAGAGAVLGAGGAAVLGSATGIAIMASLFGAAGAGLTGEEADFTQYIRNLIRKCIIIFLALIYTKTMITNQMYCILYIALSCSDT